MVHLAAVGAGRITRFHFEDERCNLFLGEDGSAFVAEPFRAGLLDDFKKASATFRIEVAVREERQGHKAIVAKHPKMEVMTQPKEVEPRKHHYVPKCWLAGFTENGKSDGRLWVTDLVKRRQWMSTPANTGHIRDFYRLEGPSSDPVIAEKVLSRIESTIAPVLRSLYENPHEANEEELEALLLFMAIQWARVPAFRPFIMGVSEAVAREHFLKSVASPEAWADYLKEANISADEPGADYEEAYKFVHEHKYTLTAETDWYVMRMFESVDRILPSLRSRHWETCISPSGSFIASDNPVALDGPKGTTVGFKNAEVIIFPVSRHVILHGTQRPCERPFVNRHYIAHINTFTMLYSEAYVFSHVSNFCWEDQEHHYQTNWELFSKEKF